MSAPDALHHVAIQVRDLARAERFYRGLLGLEVLRRWPDERGGERSVWLALGDAFLALERAAGDVEARAFRDERPGLHLVALRIRADERSGWEARLAGAGVAVVHRTEFTLYVQDPEGNRVGLSHWPERASGETA
jgi:catechol 2,3-dioxygenase-like lactoylglutathione lyase family enzyme